MTDQAQCDELLAALTKRPMTAMEILLELGIGRPSARIYDLRQQGHPIHSTEVVVNNRKGKPCRVAASTPAARGIDLRNAILKLREDALHMKDPGDTVNAYNRVLALIDASPKGVTLHNDGNSEAQFIADAERLNCPACGGSGHVDDSAKGGSTERERFEAWAKREGYGLSRATQNGKAIDFYELKETRRVWEGWQAAMQATIAEVGS